MEQKVRINVEKQLKKQQRKKIWKRIVSALSCIVVFCTTYALILPAITMSGTSYCGMEEHTHVDQCRTHELICTLSTEETQSAGHTHEAACYQLEKKLICTLSETEGHIHDENCTLTEQIVNCGIEESEAHLHSEDCFVENVTYTCDLPVSEGHTHSEICYEEQNVLVCDLTESSSENTVAHVHTEVCYKEIQICQLNEHTHELICFSNPKADVEMPDEWEATLPKELIGVWADDVLLIAESQKGYEESVKNYIVENGNKKGYTRYGDWYGDDYGHWCAMFVSFCLHYADVEGFPLNSNCQNWIETLSKEEYQFYHEAGEYEPQPGDLIFFDWDKIKSEAERDSDHVGFVVEVIPATEEKAAQVKTIEGNASDRVKYETYDLDDSMILGYGQLPKNPEKEQAETLEEVKEEVVEEQTTQTIVFEDEDDWMKAEVTFETGILPADAILTVGFVEENEDALNEAISEYIKKDEKELFNTFLFTAKFTDKDGNEIKADGDVKMEIIFNEAIEMIESQAMMISKDEEDSSKISTQWNYYRVDADNNVDGSEEDALQLSEDNAVEGISTVYKNNAVYALAVTGETAQEEQVTNKATYAINDAYAPRNITRVGAWGRDVVNIAKDQIGYNEENGVSKFDQWAGSNGYNNWNVNFVNYCLYYAGVDTDAIPWNTSYDYHAWQTALKNVAEYNTYTNGAAKVGDIVFVQGWNAGQEYNVGIIVEDTGAQYKIVFGDMNGNGRVEEQEFYKDWTQRILGYVTLSKSFEYQAQDYDVTVSYNKLDDIKDVIIKIEDTNQKAPAWTELVNAEITDSKMVVLTNHFISIEIKDSTGQTVKPEGTVVLNIELHSPLSANKPEGGSDTEIEWMYHIIKNDTEVMQPQYEGVLIRDGKEALSSLEIQVEDAEIYAFTSVQLNGGDELRYEVDSITELINAFGVNTDAKVNVVLGNNIDAASLGQSLEIASNDNFVLDLNGHSIIADSTVFTVDGGKFTIKDSQATEEEIRVVGDVNPAADLTHDTVKGDRMVGREAAYNSQSKKLTYYVTTSEVIEQKTGETREQLVEHNVTLQGTISGRAGTSPVMEVKSGRVDINSGAIVDCQTSAIVQSGGSIYLNGGYICGNSTSDSGGAINAKGTGAIIYQNGSVLAANTAGNNGGAIAIDGKMLVIDGGVISGNTTSGAGSGGGVFAKGSTAVKIRDGYLTNNRCESEDYYAGGGGIYTTNQATLHMSGGFVTGNYVGGGGGGIRTSAGTMQMSGGNVSSNFAENAEGGGISIDQPCVTTISAGYINNNVSNTAEHWGGGGIFCANDSTLYVTCVLVTENKAGGYGGGVAGCSTGRTFICEHNGGAIFDNKACEPGESHLSGGTSQKNEDHEYATGMFLQYGYDDFFSAFNSVVGGTMLGGQPAYWKGSIDGEPVIADANDTLVSSYLMGLTAYPTQTGKDAASMQARVFVNGNDSYTHGGGILCNGYMLIGAFEEVEVYSRLEVFGRKELITDRGEEQQLTAGQFEFEIVSEDTGHVVATGTNDEFGNITFNKMIPFTEAGVYLYKVYEKQDVNNDGIMMDSAEYEMRVTVDRIYQGQVSEHIEKYRYEITHLKVDKITADGRTTIHDYDPEDKDQYSVELHLTEGASFTNIMADATNISVIKNWVGEQPENGTTINVQLKRNGVSYGNPVTLSQSNGWAYNWGKMPLKEVVNGKEVRYTYTVEELNIPDGYQVEYKSYTTSERKEVWVEASGNTLVDHHSYAILSPNGDYALYLNSGEQAITSSSNASIAKSNGEILMSALPAQSILGAYTKGETWGELMLKSPNAGWVELYVSNGTLSTGWKHNTNLYVGDTRINYDENSTSEYVIVFDNGTFRAVSRQDATLQNLAKLYVPQTVMGGTELVFSVTNKKVNEEDITYKLDITKVSADDNNIRLAGAHFELYQADANGEMIRENDKPVAVTFVRVTAGRYEYCEPDAEGATTDIVSETVTAVGGKLILAELPAGNYVLRETHAPNGYEEVEDQKITLGNINQPTIELFLEDEKIAEVYELPETGGLGRNAYIAGGILLLMISVLLDVKKKNQMKGGQVSN